MSVSRGAKLAIVGLVAGVALVPLPWPAAAQVPSVENPPIEPTCGIDLTLVLDASGSVQSAGAVEDVRGAGTALLEALGNTDSTARVLQFATFSQELAVRVQIDDATLASDGALGEAMTGYYNPRPPRPTGSDIYSYDGGDPQDSGSFDPSESDQYTNWDASLDQARAEAAELVVYVTDGDPTAYNLDQPGDPFDPADAAVGTDSGAAAATTIDRAVEEANQIKDAGTRILAVGVGAALGNPDSQARLEQIAGPQVVDDDDLDTIDDINEIDVALVENFEDLAAFLRGIAFSLCSPSLTIRKLAQHPDDPAYSPEEGWSVTVTPTVAGGDFEWVLPDTDDAPSKTVDTDSNGFAQFQWDPDPPGADSAVTVAEETQDDDYTAGRPDGDDYRCELRDVAGNVREVSGDFADPSDPSYEIDPMRLEIATCTIYNSFDYDPQIAIDKTNTPTEVRGDLTPPAEVTSQFVVTNPGNTPIADPVVTDDRCTPVEFDSGDTDGDGLLDPGEEWLFTCSRPVHTEPSTDPAGQNIVNNVEVTGTGVDGTVVTAADRDDVDAFNPAITLDKNAEPTSVVVGGEVTYTYLVTNTGNTPLSAVDLTDDTPPCESPTLMDDGDGDQILAVGESWTYECVSSDMQEGVVNTATVEGTPLNPVTHEPFEGSNPPVTDTDRARVSVVPPPDVPDEPEEPGQPEEPPLPATGGVTWLPEALLAGILLIALGTGLLVTGRRFGLVGSIR